MRFSVSLTNGPAMVTTPMAFHRAARTGADMAAMPGAKTSMITLKPRLRAART